jgi:hypothetical protein
MGVRRSFTAAEVYRYDHKPGGQGDTSAIKGVAGQYVPVGARCHWLAPPGLVTVEKAQTKRARQRLNQERTEAVTS